MQIVQNRKWYYFFSGTLIAASIIGLLFFGLHLGIDFTGGSMMELRFQENVESQDISKKLEELQMGNVSVLSTDANTWIFRLPPLSEEKHQEILSKFSHVEELRFDSIGPSIGNELKKKSVQSLFVIIVAIILYIAWAFRKVSKPIASWKYGLIAVIALIHDVGITIGVFTFLGRFFAVEIDTAFVAALLTILGYSVNDTIVVFDRIRENLKRSGGTLSDFENITNQSVNQTMRRSLFTSLTTLLALFAIFFFGGASIHYFSLALIIGIGIGTYSSIFIATPLLVSWERHIRKNI